MEMCSSRKNHEKQSLNYRANIWTFSALQVVMTEKFDVGTRVDECRIRRDDAALSPD